MGRTCHDYIHTSIKILEEITRKSGGVKLREDNILFMLSARLKDIANNEGIFLMSGTQLNALATDYDTPDQSLLRGAKSIADRADAGMIILPVKEEDVAALSPILATSSFERPDLKISIYKNRRGRYKGVYLWAKANLGICRIDPMFCTTYGYELVQINNAKITTESSAF